MKDWTEVFPHDIHASILLLDDKIFNYKIGRSRWTTPSQVHMKLSDFDKQNRMSIVSKKYTVFNKAQHNEVDVLAREWMKNWKVHEDYSGYKVY